jgi:hypothetical protein
LVGNDQAGGAESQRLRLSAQARVRRIDVESVGGFRGSAQKLGVH